jgi:phosphate transport system substrate-binding protein
MVALRAAQIGAADLSGMYGDLETSCTAQFFPDLVKGLKQHYVLTHIVAFVTHMSNPVESLSLNDFKKIYSGEITNWQQVGGPDLPIVVFDQSIFAIRTMLRSKFDLKDFREDTIKLVSSQNTLEAIENFPAAIGYVPLGAVFGEWKIKILKIDGVIPNFENVHNKKYLLYHDWYWIYKNELNPKGKLIVDFCDSNPEIKKIKEMVLQGKELKNE